MKYVKEIVFIPSDKNEAAKIAHWLNFRGIPFTVGKTCGKGRGVIACDLNLKEKTLFRLACGKVKYVEYVNYYVLENVGV